TAYRETAVHRSGRIDFSSNFQAVATHLLQIREELPAQRLQFARQRVPQRAVRSEREHSGQRDRASPSRPRLCRDAAGFPYPSPENALAASVELALRRVVWAEVATASHFRIEAVVFVAAGEIESPQHGGDDQDVFSAQREKVRTLPHFADIVRARTPRHRIAESYAQGMQVIPMEQIVRAEQQRRTATIRESGTHDHVPRPVLLPQPRIAKSGNPCGSLRKRLRRRR